MHVNIVLLIVLFGSSSFAETLSLSEAKKLVSDSPRAQASQAGARGTGAALDTARAAFWPQVNLYEGFSATNDPVGVFGTKLEQGRFAASDFDLASLNSPSPVTNWRTRIEVMQPILHSFTDIRNREAAADQKDAQTFRHSFNLLQLRRQVTQLYWSAIAMKARTSIVTEGIDLLTKLEGSYQFMSAPTAATTTNFLISQSVRLGLEAQRSGLKSSHSHLLHQLSALLGMVSAKSLELSDSLPTVETLTLEASSNGKAVRPDVLAAKADAKAAESSQRASKAEWGPHLDALAGYNLYTEKWSDFGDSFDAGVQLTWPIFQGPRFGKIRSASYASEAAKQQLRAVEMEADASETNAEADLKARIEEFRLLQVSESKASEAFRLAKKRYAEGILSLFDYSQSIQNWVTIRQQTIEVQRLVADAASQLEFERGTL